MNFRQLCSFFTCSWGSRLDPALPSISTAISTAIATPFVVDDPMDVECPVYWPSDVKAGAILPCGIVKEEPSEGVQIIRSLIAYDDALTALPKVIQFCLDRKLSDWQVGDLLLNLLNRLIEQRHCHPFSLTVSLDRRHPASLLQLTCSLALKIRHEALLARLIGSFKGGALEHLKLENSVKDLMLARHTLSLVDPEEFHALAFGVLLTRLRFDFTDLWCKAALQRAIFPGQDVKRVFTSFPHLPKAVLFDLDGIEPQMHHFMHRQCSQFLQEPNVHVGRFLNSLIYAPESMNLDASIQFISRGSTQMTPDYLEILVKTLFRKNRLGWLTTLLARADRRTWRRFRDPKLKEMTLENLEIFELIGGFIEFDCIPEAPLPSIKAILLQNACESLPELLQQQIIPLHLKMHYVIRFGSGPDALASVLNSHLARESVTFDHFCEAAALVFRVHCKYFNLVSWLRVLQVAVRKKRAIAVAPSKRIVHLHNFNAEAIVEALSEANELTLLQHLEFHFDSTEAILKAILQSERIFGLAVHNILLFRHFGIVKDVPEAILGCQTTIELERLFSLLAISRAQQLEYFHWIRRNSHPDRIASLSVMFEYWRGLDANDFLLDCPIEWLELVAT